jgi:hypothetical protein
MPKARISSKGAALLPLTPVTVGQLDLLRTMLEATGRMNWAACIMRGCLPPCQLIAGLQIDREMSHLVERGWVRANAQFCQLTVRGFDVLEEYADAPLAPHE